VALVVRRWDDAPGLSVTMTVGFAPASWSTATIVLLLAGGLGTASGLALLLLRRPWIDPAHPMVAGLDEDVIEPVLVPDAVARRRPGFAAAPAGRSLRRRPATVIVGHATVEQDVIDDAPRWRRIVLAWVARRRRDYRDTTPVEPTVESPYVHTAT
jgi:hypothetical protein